LDAVTSDTLVIGRDDAQASGTLTISSPITRAGGTDLTLVSPAGIRPNASGTDLDLEGGTLTFRSGSKLAIAINSTTADTGYQQLNVNGSVDLTGVDLVLSGAYTPVIGDTFTLVNATSLLGQFNGLPNGGTVKSNGRSFRAAYDATSMKLTLINNNPTANHDTLTVAANAPATVVNVLANDTDPDAGQTRTVTAVTPAAHGTATLSGGVVTYQPNANYSGSDSFTYTISDGFGGTATATVHVTVPPLKSRVRLTAVRMRQRWRLTAVVVGMPAIPPGGRVQFYTIVNGRRRLLGSAGLVRGRATLPAKLRAGRRRVIAVYTGDGLYTPSETMLVVKVRKNG
jgi:hypothetical protein